jgi:hypothetical protein
MKEQDEGDDRTSDEASPDSPLAVTDGDTTGSGVPQQVAMCHNRWQYIVTAMRGCTTGQRLYLERCNAFSRSLALCTSSCLAPTYKYMFHVMTVALACQTDCVGKVQCRCPHHRGLLIGIVYTAKPFFVSCLGSRWSQVSWNNHTFGRSYDYLSNLHPHQIRYCDPGRI